MASVTAELALLAVPQATDGTIDPTLSALSAADVHNEDGLVLGTADAGELDSGIDFQTERASIDVADVGGSFTKNLSTFLREDIGTFTFAWQLKGPGKTRGPSVVDADYALDAVNQTDVPSQAVGVDAILQCCGLSTSAGWGSGDGWTYQPGSSANASMRVYDSGLKWDLKDVTGDIEFVLTPGGLIIATATMSGTVHDVGALAFPTTLDYGNQSAISAPVVESVQNVYPSPTLKGWDGMTISVNNQREEVLDSNAAGGVSDRQTGREVTLSYGIYSDDGNLDFEHEELVKAAATSENMAWLVGDQANADTEVIKAVRFDIPEQDIRSIKTRRTDARRVVEVTSRAVSSAQNGELLITFL